MKKLIFAWLMIWAIACLADTKAIHGTAASPTDATHPLANGRDCMTLDHHPIASSRWLHATDGKWYHCEDGTWVPQAAVIAKTQAKPAVMATTSATATSNTKPDSFPAWKARMHANAASLDIFGYNRKLSVADEFAARNYRREHPLEFPLFGYH